MSKQSAFLTPSELDSLILDKAEAMTSNLWRLHPQDEAIRLLAAWKSYWTTREVAATVKSAAKDLADLAEYYAKVWRAAVKKQPKVKLFDPSEKSQKLMIMFSDGLDIETAATRLAQDCLDSAWMKTTLMGRAIDQGEYHPYAAEMRSSQPERY